MHQIYIVMFSNRTSYKRMQAVCTNKLRRHTFFVALKFKEMMNIRCTFKTRSPIVHSKK